MSADPVAVALVGYRRLGLWQAITRGKLIAWGLTPWLGFRMGNLFFNP